MNSAGACADVRFDRRNRSIGFPTFATGIVDKFERIGDGEKWQGLTGSSRCFKCDGSERRGVSGGDGHGIDAKEECGTQDSAKVAGIELRETLASGNHNMNS